MTNTCFTNNQEKTIYFTSDGVVMKKTVTKEDSVSKKLDKLRSLLKVYAKQYEARLREKNIEEEKIKELSFEWVEQTLRHYEVNFGDTLDSVIAYLECQTNEYKNESNKKGQSPRCR